MSQLVQIEKKIKVKSQLRNRKPLLIALLVALITLIVIAGLAIFLVVIPAQKVTGAANTILATLSQLKDDLEGKDLSNIDDYFTDIRTQLDSINTEVAKYEFLKDLSVTKGYYDNLQVVRQLSDRTDALLETTLPQLKVILQAMGYKVEPDAVEISAETVEEDDEKLQSLISQLPELVKLYDQIEIDVLEIISIFNQLDPAYIPNLGSSGMRDKIIEAQKLTEEFPVVSAQAKELLRVAPQLLGSEKPAEYMLIFQNEKELRSSGGLLSAYGNLTIDKGKLGDSINATDMWDLEGYVSWTLGVDVGHRNTYGQNALMNAGCGSTYLRAQDSGVYPDLYESMNIFKDYYDVANRYNPGKYKSYEHIIIVNTFFASDIISLVEPLEVQENGQVKIITAENAAKEIFAVTSSGPFDPATRKDFVGEVATAVKDKFNNLSAADFPRIAQLLIRTMQAKNIAFYSKDEAVQAYFDELGLSGRIEHNFAGDYLNIGEAQNCSLKSNFYVYDVVSQNVNIDESGRISKDVNIHWVNEKVYDPNEPNILSSSPYFRYRAWVRIFAPQGTQFTKSDGYEKSQYFYSPVKYFDEVMQKETYDNVIWFDHRRLWESDSVKTHDLTVSYNLPADIVYTEEQGYRLLIQKHPGKKNELYKVNVNFKGAITSTEFRLERDKVLTFLNGVITVQDYDTRLDQYYELAESLKEISVE
jgi:hypothetical protein